MKFGVAVFAAVLCVAMGPEVAAAVSAPAALNAFSKTSTDIGATNSHVIISANGNGAPRVEYVNVTSDKAGALLLFYTTSPGVVLNLATNASQAVLWLVGTSYAANDIVVLRHLSTDVYERLVVSASTSTNVTATASVVGATVAGDILYKVTAGPAIAVGAATVAVSTASGAVYNGKEGLPLYAEVDGTSASQINLISGIYSLYRQSR